MFTTKRIQVLFSVLIVIFMASCNLPGAEKAAEQSQEEVETMVAQTVAAHEAAQSEGEPGSGEPASAPSDTPSTGEEASPPASDTPSPGATNTPFPTNAPAASNTPIPCNMAEFVEDVTIPDGTDFNPGDTFTKTWRLKNIGSCEWSSGYDIVFSSGDAMSAPSAVQLTNAIIPSGGTVDVSVTFTAPNSSGAYRSNWKLRDQANQVFGIQNSSSGEFWVEIEVLPPSPTPEPTDSGIIIITPPILVLQPFVDKVYEQGSIEAGATGYVTASCPSNSLVTGGGFAANTDVLIYNSSKQGNGWRVYGKNNGGSSNLVNAYAVCIFNFGTSTTQVHEQISAPAGGIGHATVSCPAGNIVTGGGWAAVADGSLRIYNSSKSGNGWEVYAENSSGSNKLLNAYAVCLEASSGWVTDATYAQDTVPGNDTKGVVATCPSGGIATGGGFAAGSNLTIYNTSPWQNDGDEWISYAKNFGGSGQLLNSYVICLSRE